MTLSNTISLTAAAAQTWDVAVIGAGPAGSMAAFLLARAGVRVILIDKDVFPRFKVCGSCLNQRALRTLDEAGLRHLVDRAGAVPLHTVLLAAGGQCARSHLPEGAALSRHVLDRALIEAAIEVGSHFLSGTRAVLGAALGGERQVDLRQHDESAALRARLVIAADGLGGRLLADNAASHAAPSSRLGAGAILEAAPASYRRGTIFMACASGGYVGLVRLEDDRLDVAAALDPQAVRHPGGIAGAVSSIIRESGLPALPSLFDRPWRGTPLLTRRALCPAAERLFAIGDAAAFVEPFTGEGIAWALASAVALMPLALEGCRNWTPALAEKWSVCYRQTIAPQQRACRMMAAVLRRPRLTKAIVRTVAAAPVLAAPVLHYLNRH